MFPFLFQDKEGILGLKRRWKRKSSVDSSFLDHMAKEERFEFQKTSLQRLPGKEFKDLWIVTHFSSFSLTRLPIIGWPLFGNRNTSQCLSYRCGLEKNRKPEKIRLEIPNLSRHDYKEKIRRFWIQDSGENNCLEPMKRNKDYSSREIQTQDI